MASVRARRKGRKTYFYLEHTTRVRGKVVKRERYLGDALPSDVEGSRRAFAREVFLEQWLADLEAIRAGYAKHIEALGLSAREKAMASFSVAYTYNTNRIEGSRLTLRETADVLERGLAPAAKPTRDVKEAEAHRDAFMEMLGSGEDLSFEGLLRYHRRLFASTKVDIAGRLR
ncbi:MAG: hypothetical protein L0213_03550, partial [Candidatus Dadabacteria bacterium]|nr:hypothetical protein [Candidatus Dadabacteria bacterium]